MSSGIWLYADGRTMPAYMTPDIEDGVKYEHVYVTAHLPLEEVLERAQEECTIHHFCPTIHFVVGCLKNGFSITATGPSAVRLIRPAQAQLPAQLLNETLIQRLVEKYGTDEFTIVQACFSATAIDPEVATDLSFVVDELRAAVECGFFTTSPKGFKALPWTTGNHKEE